MLIIYTTKTSARQAYIFDEIFHHRLGMDYKCTQDMELYLQSENAIRINYSNTNCPGLQISPSGLLYETGINNEFKPTVTHLGEDAVLFSNQKCSFGYDIFSMAFWLLSRYEEYQPFAADAHGRFEAPQSLLYENGIYTKPILDIALNQFYKKLGLTTPNKYAVYPTIDIDIAYKHKGKPLAIWLIGLAKMLLAGDVQNSSERIRVLFGEKDPWDTYGYLISKLKPFAQQCRFFIQVGSRSRYDKPVKITNPSFAKTVKQLNATFELGLHPNYKNGNTQQGIESQKAELEHYLGKPVIRSRQHFLRLQVPNTWEWLYAHGIQHDYTMGYSGYTGFRAGTGHAFRFYNINKEETYPITIHPFSLMDVSLKNGMGLSKSSAIAEIRRLKEICTIHSVPFCFIFHNESVGNEGAWAGYKELFELCLK